MLEDSQRPPPTRVLEPRLESEHLAHTQREALGKTDVRLNLAGRAVAGVQNRSELMPSLRRSRFDDRGDRTIEQQCNQDSQGDRLVRHYQSIRILEPAHHE